MIGRHTCELCKNFIQYDENWEAYCKAFPNGIPYDVYNKIDPWKPPKECNNGIGYEPEEDESE